MVLDIGFEPMMRDSESLALPLGESRKKGWTQGSPLLYYVGADLVSALFYFSIIVL